MIRPLKEVQVACRAYATTRLRENGGAILRGVQPQVSNVEPAFPGVPTLATEGDARLHPVMRAVVNASVQLRGLIVGYEPAAKCRMDHVEQQISAPARTNNAIDPAVPDCELRERRSAECLVDRRVHE